MIDSACNSCLMACRLLLFSTSKSAFKITSALICGQSPLKVTVQSPFKKKKKIAVARPPQTPSPTLEDYTFGASFLRTYSFARSLKVEKCSKFRLL